MYYSTKFFCSIKYSRIFRIPNDVMVICLGKSTYARCGIIVNVTPLEPSWEGNVTLEFSNSTPLPAKYMRTKELRNLFF
jgi:dCTP deaminase